jgi:hypothetical protein
VLDVIAGAGLVAIGAAPVFALGLDLNGTTGDVAAMALGAAYLALAATTARHVLLYRALAEWAAAAGHESFPRRLIVLGYAKAFYEAAWLACCGLPLVALGLDVDNQIVLYPAVAALLGCFGFAPIWVWMIVAHARLASALR